MSGCPFGGLRTDNVYGSDERGDREKWAVKRERKSDREEGTESKIVIAWTDLFSSCARCGAVRRGAVLCVGVA